MYSKILSSYWMRLIRLRRIMQVEEDVVNRGWGPSSTPRNGGVHLTKVSWNDLSVEVGKKKKDRFGEQRWYSRLPSLLPVSVQVSCRCHKWLECVLAVSGPFGREVFLWALPFFPVFKTSFADWKSQIIVGVFNESILHINSQVQAFEWLDGGFLYQGNDGTNSWTPNILWPNHSGINSLLKKEIF